MFDKFDNLASRFHCSLYHPSSDITLPNPLGSLVNHRISISNTQLIQLPIPEKVIVELIAAVVTKPDDLTTKLSILFEQTCDYLDFAHLALLQFENQFYLLRKYYRQDGIMEVLSNSQDLAQLERFLDQLGISPMEVYWVLGHRTRESDRL